MPRIRLMSDGEAKRFRVGDGPTVLELDGWRLGVRKDTGAGRHPGEVVSAVPVRDAGDR